MHDPTIRFAAPEEEGWIMQAAESGRNTQTPDIDVKSVGVRWYHPAGFLVDRPNGSGDYAFMQWLTKARIKIDGVVTVEREGGCILFRPEDPQWFGGDVFTPFGNNWFHFQGAKAGALLDECGLPVNRVIRLRDNSFVEPILNLLMRECMEQPPLWRRMTASVVERLFVEMARAMGGVSTRLKSNREAGLKTLFEELRYELQERSTEQWTLQSMAERVHLSPSRFGRLYREIFGANPVDDLIRMRIAKAEYYLCMTNIPVGGVAELCGFSDVYYFSRQFKSKTGETPSAYRLLHGGAGE